MPPAWKLLTYATVVLVVFAVAATTWAESADATTLVFLFVTLSITVGIGYYVGNNVFVADDE